MPGAVIPRMASGGEGHRHARSQTMPIIRGKNALMNPKLLQMMETGKTQTEDYNAAFGGLKLHPALDSVCRWEHPGR